MVTRHTMGEVTSWECGAPYPARLRHCNSREFVIATATARGEPPVPSSSGTPSGRPANLVVIKLGGYWAVQKIPSSLIKGYEGR